MSGNTPKVSIIIRTFNEERWIAHCLGMIFDQEFNDFEVILVDNNSTDHTVELAKRYPISTHITIDKFFPGKALNDGIRASNGRYIASISAHCVPQNKQWLKRLFNNFKSNGKLAGVYGRQLPLSYTNDADKRDLLITFGRDRKVQKKDYFFHNANSMLPRSIWELFPFDENSTNIEDRIWGKQIIEAGYEIIYDPTAPVYHYHGLHHHGSSSKRARGIATILDKVDKEDVGNLPESLKPENVMVAAVLLVNEELTKDSLEFKLLLNSIDEIRSSSYVNEIYIASHDKAYATLTDTQWIDRNRTEFDDSNSNVEKLLSFSLKEIEAQSFFPEIILYVNHHYAFRPKGLFNNLIEDMQYKGCSSVFPCFVDYGHYWQHFDDNGFSQIDASLESRDKREPVMRALYGLGCVTASSEIRKASITGDNVGIISIDDYRFTLNTREKGSLEIINKII
jgi:glycosyltransferase involved in cell wall biosynthesis